jgi:hypothetical protein
MDGRYGTGKPGYTDEFVRLRAIQCKARDRLVEKAHQVWRTLVVGQRYEGFVYMKLARRNTNTLVYSATLCNS